MFVLSKKSWNTFILANIPRPWARLVLYKTALLSLQWECRTHQALRRSFWVKNKEEQTEEPGQKMYYSITALLLQYYCSITTLLRHYYSSSTALIPRYYCHITPALLLHVFLTTCWPQVWTHEIPDILFVPDMKGEMPPRNRRHPNILKVTRRGSLVHAPQPLSHNAVCVLLSVEVDAAAFLLLISWVELHSWLFVAPWLIISFPRLISLSFRSATHRFIMSFVMSRF